MIILDSFQFACIYVSLIYYHSLTKVDLVLIWHRFSRVMLKIRTSCSTSTAAA